MLELVNFMDPYRKYNTVSTGTHSRQVQVPLDTVLRIRIRDPGYDAFLTSSGIRDQVRSLDSDPG
jgi:hypothetical protein